jgi:hypothetical protein
MMGQHIRYYPHLKTTYFSEALDWRLVELMLEIVQEKWPRMLGQHIQYCLHLKTTYYSVSLDWQTMSMLVELMREIVEEN